MAQKVIVALEDDLDGGPADETVRFAFDGTEYEIDLSAKNARAFRKKLTPFVEHARKAGRGPGRRAARTPAGRRDRAVPGRHPRTLNQRRTPHARVRYLITERQRTRHPPVTRTAESARS
jgi:nucleoid-associated protein Lsr2